MPDLKIRQDTGFPAERVWLDYVQAPDGLLAEGPALEALMIVALGTDARALDDDVLPDPDDTDRRGWWGDLNAEIWDGWPIGCRLWLYVRSKITGPLAREGATTTRIEAAIREALQPMIDRRIASRMAVEVVRVDRSRIDAAVTLYRGPKEAIALRFRDLWDELG